MTQEDQSPVFPTISGDIQPSKVSIIILTHNQLEYTKQCMESIKKYTRHPHQLILVDNGSSDGTQEYLQSIINQKRLDGDDKVISNQVNLGFAKGCNQGIEEATGKYILLLNNDVIVTQDWLKRLVTCIESHPRIGIVGPMTNYISNGPQRVWRPTYSSLEEMHAYASQFYHENKGDWFDCPRIVGFCMLVKQAVVKKIGGLDGRYGIGCFEDDDYCFRVHKAGYRVVVAGDVFIHHFGQKTFKAINVDYKNLMNQNRKIFLEKWNANDRKLIRKYLMRQVAANIWVKFPKKMRMMLKSFR